MSEYIKVGLKLSWLFVIVIWIISGFFTKKVENQESILKRFLLYWLPIIIAGYLLGSGKWFGHTWLRENFVPHSNFVGIIGLLFCVSGVFILCWSRYLLGADWSLSVQRKVGHELVQKGIYGIVRHPIYTGLLLLFIGNAIIVGDYRAILAVLIVFFSLWFKIKKEEKLLLETFGSHFTEYQNHTKALVPFLI